MLIVRSMWDDPPQPYYPDIDVPVTVIPAGSNDPGGHLAGLARVTVRAYPGADHDVHAQYPERIAADLLSLPQGSTR